MGWISSGRYGATSGAKTATSASSAVRATPKAAVRLPRSRRAKPASRPGRRPSTEPAKEWESRARPSPQWVGEGGWGGGREVPKISGRRPIADPGVEVEVDEVHGEVHEDEAGGHEQDDPLDHAVVSLLDRGQRESADPRPAEDLLDDDAAAEERADLH